MCESSSVMISRTVSCSVKFCSYIISCLRCVASTMSDLSGNLQLLENQAKHSRPDQALQTLEERRTLCRNAEELVGTGKERGAGSLAVFGRDLTDTRV